MAPHQVEDSDSGSEAPNQQARTDRSGCAGDTSKHEELDGEKQQSIDDDSKKIPLISSSQDHRDRQSNRPQQEEVEVACCRFCWGNEHVDDNPLIQSCHCSGGVEFIHFDCLRRWIKTKMTAKETDKLKQYLWTSFECEICKAPFPFEFKTSNGRKYTLFDY